jgi:hypothetical protein
MEACHDLSSTVNPLSKLTPAEPGARARPGDRPSPERLREIAEAVRTGSYRVPPGQIAAALLGARGDRRD